MKKSTPCSDTAMPNESKAVNWRELLKAYMRAVQDTDPIVGHSAVQNWGDYTDAQAKALNEISAELHFEAVR